MSFFGNLQGGGIKGPDVVINGDGDEGKLKASLDKYV